MTSRPEIDWKAKANAASRFCLDETARDRLQLSRYQNERDSNVVNVAEKTRFNEQTGARATPSAQAKDRYLAAEGRATSPRRRMHQQNSKSNGDEKWTPRRGNKNESENKFQRPMRH